MHDDDTGLSHTEMLDVGMPESAVSPSQPEAERIARSKAFGQDR